MRSRSALACLFFVASGFLANAFAQDEEADPPPSPKPVRRKAPKAQKPPKSPKSRKAGPVDMAKLTALNSALSEELLEEQRKPLVSEEADTGDEEQTIVSLTVLDRNLSALLKRKGLEPLLEAATPETGLGPLFEQVTSGTLQPRIRASGAPTDAPSETPSEAPSAVTVATPPTAAATPAPVAATPQPAAEEFTDSNHFQLVKILVKRDGTGEVEVPVGTGPVTIEHHGGTPPVELSVVVDAPRSIILGQPVTLNVRGTAKGPTVTAELGIVRETLQPVTAATDTISSGGRVNFAFVRKVGGMYAYQQTFAQLEGGKTPPASLINWSDRDRTIQLEFAWASTAPAALHIDGRLIYQLQPRRKK